MKLKTLRKQYLITVGQSSLLLSQNYGIFIGGLIHIDIRD